MMSPVLFKDVSIATVLFINANFSFQWPILYPYIGSYYKQFDSSITLKSVFSCILLLYFGMFIGNLVLPRFFYLFGLRKTLQIGSTLYFINLVCMYTFTSLLSFCFNMIIAGALVNFFSFTISVYFSQKYENGILYCPFVFMGATLGVMVWPLVVSAIVNPENRSMDQIDVTTGVEEYYYDYSVSSRIISYFNIHGLIAMAVNVLLCHYLENPEGHRGRISKWLSQRGEPLIDNEDYESFKYNIEHQLSMNISRALDTSRSFLATLNPTLNITQPSGTDIELLAPQSFASRRSENPQQVAVEYHKEVLTSRFMLLMLASIIRVASLTYFICNSKFIASSVLDNDNLVSIFLSVTSVLDIVGRLIGPYLWIRLGFFKVMVLLVVLSMIFNLSFILSHPANAYTFFGLFALCRFATGINAAVSAITLFSLYTADQAIYLYKVFDNVTLLALVYSVLMNYFLVAENNFVPIFAIFLLVEGFGLVVLVLKLRTAYQ